jgi:beta-galactosidase
MRRTSARVDLSRRNGDRSWLFLLNHTGAAHEVAATGTELLTGTAVTGTIELPPGGSAVIALA